MFKPGQVLQGWWQDYVLGALKTPQDLFRHAFHNEIDPARQGNRFISLPDDDSWQAPERLKAPRFMLTDRFAAQWDRADWQFADPRLMKWSAMLIESARKRDIPLFVHCCFRGEAEQNAVHAKGHSKARYPSSAHNIAEAVDIVHGVLGWDMTPQEWRMIHVLGNLCLDRMNAKLPKDHRLNLTWGGNWSFYDPAHWEVTDFRGRLRRLPEGEPLRYTPRYILRYL